MYMYCIIFVFSYSWAVTYLLWSPGLIYSLKSCIYYINIIIFMLVKIKLLIILNLNTCQMYICLKNSDGLSYY